MTGSELPNHAAGFRSLFLRGEKKSFRIYRPEYMVPLSLGQARQKKTWQKKKEMEVY